MALSLRTYDSLTQLEALRPAWEELLSNYPPATTFSTWEWLSSWWSCFGRNRRLLVLALFDSGRIVGLAPLSISAERLGWFWFRVLRLMGDGSNDSDNLDVPVLPGHERAFAESVLTYLRQHRREWDICQLNTLPFASLGVSCLIELLRSSSWTFWEGLSDTWAVELPASWDLYSQILSSEDRKNLVRYTRRLQTRHSVRTYRCSDASHLPVCLDALFRLHQGRWQDVGQSGTFSSSERREFYAQLSRNLLARGWLELWVLELEGEIAAVQFAFRYRDRVFQLQEGYDHRRSSDRLGFVLRGHVLKQLIEEKVRTYDFLGGEDPHKKRWGARESHYLQLEFSPRFGLGSAWLHFVHRADRSKEWLRQTLPASAWSVLHKTNVFLRRSKQTEKSDSASATDKFDEKAAGLQV
jgi:CelD/BcsL family acetyltransferase involved in cellulose biosynthesis